MLVYGDRTKRADPRERLSTIAEQCAAAALKAPGIHRHSTLVAILIEAGRILQGVADADFEQVGEDRPTAATDALADFLVRLGSEICRSWDNFDCSIELPSAPAIDELPDWVHLREPEGFAYYAVYPEAYIDAARTLPLQTSPCVIGIRSIGTSLAAVVAATLGASSFVTVRPFGDPFARQIAIAPQLEQELLAGASHYLIVDEGPGQSGSSFGAVADWLQQRGVALERIAFMPSHAGDLGPEASDMHRRRWDEGRRAVADFGSRLPNLLERWATELLGPLDRPLEDLSGGAWRRFAYTEERHWPAVNPAWERRKYLARANGETWLLKFAGLGPLGERKLDMARELHAAGVAPEQRGLLHGFLCERWQGEATRLTASDKPLQRIAKYLGMRARLFPARDGDGAPIEALFKMMRRNIGLALGETTAAALLDFGWRLDSLQRRVQRVRTDNRLDPHEWLRLPDGRLLKTDALDHHLAHDLVGAQDLAWDVAGASIEFELNERGCAWLAAEVGVNRPIDSELLEFMTIAYLAFRLGHIHLSIPMCAGNTAETKRLLARAAFYSQRLRTGLSSRLSGNPPSISKRNEPQWEQSYALGVDEEEASTVVNMS